MQTSKLCIAGTHFLVLHSEVFALFDFDLHLSVTCSALIRWHNHQVDENRKQESEEEPWFSMSYEFLRHTCLGMVSRRKLQDCVKELMERGYLHCDRSGSFQRTRYLVNTEKIAEDIKELPGRIDTPDPEECPNRRLGWEAAQRSVGTYAHEENGGLRGHGCPTTVGTDAHDTVGTDAHIDISKVLEEEKEEYKPPIVPQEEFNCDTFIKIVSTRLKNAGVKLNLRSKHHQEVRERLCAAAQAVGEDQAVEQLEESLIANGDQFSIHRFVTTLSNGLKCKRSKPRKEASWLHTSSTPPIASPAPSAPAKNGIPEEALRWNERAPSRAWKVWTNALQSALREKLRDPNFVSHYNELLDKVEQIGKAGHAKSDFFSIEWVLKEDNWGKILNGGCNWLLSTTDEKTKSGKNETAKEKARRLFAKEIELANATDAGKL